MFNRKALIVRRLIPVGNCRRADHRIFFFFPQIIRKNNNRRSDKSALGKLRRKTKPIPPSGVKANPPRNPPQTDPKDHMLLFIWRQKRGSKLDTAARFTFSSRPSIKNPLFQLELEFTIILSRRTCHYPKCPFGTRLTGNLGSSRALSGKNKTCGAERQRLQGRRGRLQSRHGYIIKTALELP